MRKPSIKSLFSSAAGLIGLVLTVYAGMTGVARNAEAQCIHLSLLVGCPVGVLNGGSSQSILSNPPGILWDGGIITGGNVWNVPAHNLSTGGGLNDSTLGVNSGPGATSQRWGDYSYLGNCPGGSCDVNGDGYEDFPAGAYGGREYSGSVYAYGPSAPSDFNRFSPAGTNTTGGSGGSATVRQWAAYQPEPSDTSNFDCGWSGSCNADPYPAVNINFGGCSEGNACGVQPVPTQLSDCTANNSCTYQPPPNSDCSGGQCTGYEQYLAALLPQNCEGNSCEAQGTTPNPTPAEGFISGVQFYGVSTKFGAAFAITKIDPARSKIPGHTGTTPYYTVVSRDGQGTSKFLGQYATQEEARAAKNQMIEEQQAATSSTVGRTPSSSTRARFTINKRPAEEGEPAFYLVYDNLDRQNPSNVPQRFSTLEEAKTAIAARNADDQTGTAPEGNGTTTTSGSQPGTQTGGGVSRGFGGKPGRFGIGADVTLGGVGGLSARFQVAKNFGVQAIIAFTRVSIDANDVEPNTTTSTVTPPNGPVFAPVVTRLPPPDGEEIYKGTFGFREGPGQAERFEVRFIREPDGKIGAWGTGDLATHRFSDGKESRGGRGFYRPEGPVIMPILVPPPATGVAAADQQQLSGPITGSASDEVDGTVISLGLNSELFGAQGFTFWFR